MRLPVNRPSHPNILKPAPKPAVNSVQLHNVTLHSCLRQRGPGYRVDIGENPRQLLRGDKRLHQRPSSSAQA